MNAIVPASKPRMSYHDLIRHLAPLGLDPAKDKLFVAGIRGYYRDSLGAPGRNDRGIYDDAIFLVSPAFFGSYNANTDPSRRKPGRGKGAEKGMACLNTGLWRAHRFDIHNGKYLALCQRAGPVTVTRDGATIPDYEDTGSFGINIHNGGWRTTSSLGCQTIHPSQWQSFITSAVDQAKRLHGDKWNKVVVPYALIDNPD
jgi:hypothetical protein